MTYFHLMFLFVELYVAKIMLQKKFSTSAILDFRHIVFNHIYNTDGLDEFNKTFFSKTCTLGGEVQKVCRHFYRYYKKFMFNPRSQLGYAERFYIS